MIVATIIHHAIVLILGAWMTWFPAPYASANLRRNSIRTLACETVFPDLRYAAKPPILRLFRQVP